ncbi:NAD-dependent epimerase/dehydratase family protein [Eubacterium sp. MSJ-13]|nr:NAD-dependent epimerase/dehydratase family protein [Eubacterium sp. MSJ-13]
MCNSELNDWFDFRQLIGKKVLVTGATGLIGVNLIKTLMRENELLSEPIHIIALVRNPDKAQKVFGDDYGNIRCITGNIIDPIFIPGEIDYIVHTASQTSSKGFVEQPLATISTAINGTLNMLELARKKEIKKFVYLSTMEVYGTPYTDEKIDESHGTNIDTMSVRSSYPESKRMCENLCVSYMKEYGVPVNVIRLTQTFGPGVAYNDGRVFAEFARCVIEKKNIILHTNGETKRNYLYTQDAVNAILTVMIKGKNGQVYNAANESTYCSIYEMAQMVAKRCAKGEIDVKIEIADTSNFGYAPTLRMNLDTSKLKSLGWKPKVGLEEMFNNLIDDMRENAI